MSSKYDSDSDSDSDCECSGRNSYTKRQRGDGNTSTRTKQIWDGGHMTTIVTAHTERSGLRVPRTNTSRQNQSEKAYFQKVSEKDRAESVLTFGEVCGREMVIYGIQESDQLTSLRTFTPWTVYLPNGKEVWFNANRLRNQINDDGSSIYTVSGDVVPRVSKELLIGNTFNPVAHGSTRRAVPLQLNK